jgi:hypothetical protein
MGSDGTGVAALDAQAAAAAAASSIAGARGGCPTGGSVRGCATVRLYLCDRVPSARVLSFRVCCHKASFGIRASARGKPPSAAHTSNLISSMTAKQTTHRFL